MVVRSGQRRVPKGPFGYELKRRIQNCSAQLGNAGITPERIATSAAVTLEKTEGGFAITAVHLDVRAKLKSGDRTAFETAANNAKAGCPVSKVLNAKITMSATLEG